MECAPSRIWAVRQFGLILIATTAIIVTGCSDESNSKKQTTNSGAALVDVTDFTATPGDGVVILAWANPAETDFAGVLILRRDDGESPIAPDDVDAIEVYDGTGELITDSGLSNGTTYYYAAYAHDSISNYSDGVTASATPVAAAGGGGGDTTVPTNSNCCAPLPGQRNSLTTPARSRRKSFPASPSPRLDRADGRYTALVAPSR